MAATTRACSTRSMPAPGRRRSPGAAACYAARSTLPRRNPRKLRVHRLRGNRGSRYPAGSATEVFNMGRFEQQDTETTRLPASLGSATDDLRSTVESEVQKIVERAEARASEIEDQALEKASRIERESER